MKKETQIVYRFLTKQELNDWLNNKNNISKSYKNDNMAQSNNHKYIEGVKYVHFFDNLTDAPFVFNIMDQNTNILCKFELPTLVLSKHEGTGSYYNQNMDKTTVTEYAIPVNLVDAKCLKEYKVINNIDSAKYINENFGWNRIINDKELEL